LHFACGSCSRVIHLGDPNAGLGMNVSSRRSFFAADRAASERVEAFKT
jgi:hypothetical protein